MHKNLLSYYRKDDVFADVKILSKESLLSDWKGKIHPESIKYLLKNYSYNYDNIIAFLPFISSVDERVKNLYSIKEDLMSSGLISKNDYLNTFFLNKDIEVYGYSNKDKELISFFNSFKLNPAYHRNEKDIHGHDVFKYETVSDEVFYSLNKIAKLLDEGIDPSRIYIFNKNEQYISYLNRYIKSFGFSIDYDDSKPLYHYEISHIFLNKFKETKNVDEALKAIQDISNKELLDVFEAAIKELTDEELPFEKQWDYFNGELKKIKYQTQHLGNCVKVVKQPIYDRGAYVFILGFTQGQFPENKKDNEFLNDNVKAELGLNTSIDKSVIEEEMLEDFLMSDNEFIISYSSRSLTEQFFASPFIEKYSFNETNDSLPETIYSSQMVDFLFAKLMDLKVSFSEESDNYYSLNKIAKIPYGEYDNSFTGINLFDDEMNIYYSYSKISTYYKCPFSYYVGSLLGIDPFEGNFYTKIGNVFHAMFEAKYKPGFNFEKQFVIEAEKENFSVEEKIILINLKEQLKEMINVLDLHHSFMTNPRYILERNATQYEFAPHSYLIGKIDKTIIINNKYIVLVDYKTGSESFNPKELVEGMSMQLPTYCLLAEHDHILKEYSVVGIYINNVINKSLTSFKGKNLINPSYTLNGYTLSDLNIASMIDNTLTTGSSEFIKSLALTKEGAFKSSSKLMSEDDLNEFKRITLENFINADKRIRNNEFPINPYYKSERDNVCTYCQYRDICFVKSEQYRRPMNAEEMEEEDE